MSGIIKYFQPTFKNIKKKKVAGCLTLNSKRKLTMKSVKDEERERFVINTLRACGVVDWACG
jgi:hypothetical protein